MSCKQEESTESCLLCRGGERCEWHSDVRGYQPRGKSVEAVKDRHEEDSTEDVGNIVADLPPELFYNYNPSGPSVPTFRVLPSPTRCIWEDKVRRRLSLEKNPQLKEEFEKMRGSGEISPVTFPPIRNFKFNNYHVRYIDEKPELEWRLFTPDTVARPKECGKAILPVDDPRTVSRVPLRRN